MADLSPVALIVILVVAVLVALLVGYLLGSRLGGKKSTAMKKAAEEQESYKADVREHFQQTSAIMSRMAEDYRDMYAHLSEGAEQLADLHREKLVTPPPSPESLTHGKTDDQASEKKAGEGDPKPTSEDKPSAADSSADKTAASPSTADKPSAAKPKSAPASGGPVNPEAAMASSAKTGESKQEAPAGKPSADAGTGDSKASSSTNSASQKA